MGTDFKYLQDQEHLLQKTRIMWKPLMLQNPKMILGGLITGEDCPQQFQMIMKLEIQDKKTNLALIPDSVLDPGQEAGKIYRQKILQNLQQSTACKKILPLQQRNHN